MSARESLEYWMDVTECHSGSRRPIGGCLHCDLRDIRDEMDELAAENEKARLIISRILTDIPLVECENFHHKKADQHPLYIRDCKPFARWKEVIQDAQELLQAKPVIKAK